MPFEDVGTTSRRKMTPTRVLKIWDAHKDSVRFDEETGGFITTQKRGKWPPGRCLGRIDSSGYRQITLGGVNLLAHRLAWFLAYGDWPPFDIDHINGVKTDNRICNLRIATRSENSANSRRPKNNTSGYKGVSWQAGLWKAQICVRRRKIHIGLYETPQEAHAAYLAKAAELFGEFARAS